MRKALRAFASGITKYLAGSANDSFGFDVVRIEEFEEERLLKIGIDGATVIEVLYRVPYRFDSKQQQTVEVKRVRMIIEVIDAEEVI